jgi:hypothetical protein
VSCRVFEGQRDTPVAPLNTYTLIDIVWACPGTAAREFRRRCSGLNKRTSGEVDDGSSDCDVGVEGGEIDSAPAQGEASDLNAQDVSNSDAAGVVDNGADLPTVSLTFEPIDDVNYSGTPMVSQHALSHNARQSGPALHKLHSKPAKGCCTLWREQVVRIKMGTIRQIDSHSASVQELAAQAIQSQGFKSYSAEGNSCCNFGPESVRVRDRPGHSC